jgi:hypothetical protein
MTQSGMDDQPTCGKGLAYNAALPAKLGDLTASVADILEHHMKALDLGDPSAAREHGAYRELVQQHRSTAGQLHATAERMASLRDLPMGKHDFQIMASPAAASVFERFVKLEQELVTYLQGRLDGDRTMLDAMRGAHS